MACFGSLLLPTGELRKPEQGCVNAAVREDASQARHALVMGFWTRILHVVAQ